MKNRKILWLFAGIVVVLGFLTTFLILRQSNTAYYHVSFDTQGGTQLESVTVKEGNFLKRPDDPIKSGYHISCWKKNDFVWDFENFKVQEDMTLVANWALTDYEIIYDFNGGKTDEEYLISYNIESEFDIVRPSKDDFVFVGWFDENNNRVDKISPGRTGELHLKAEYINNLIILNSDESKGAVKTNGEDISSNTVTLEFVPMGEKYHLFKGWYDNKDNLISSERIIQINLDKDTSTTIKVEYLSASEENEWNVSHGVVPSIESNEDFMSFGLYPQSNVGDERIIEELEKLKPTSFNGFYYYNHEYYAKHVASLYSTEEESPELHSFDNGVEIIDGDSYWFKLEPIRWRIIKKESNIFTILTDRLLDVIRYYENALIRTIDDQTIFPNNYKYSDLRKWLNEDFYDSAFYFNKNGIIKTEVDNSPSSTSTEENQYACENTIDFIFSLSYQDYQNSDYGFSSNKTRTAKTTDLSRSNNAAYDKTDIAFYCGYTWTRSPLYSPNEERMGTNVSKISRDGVVNACWNGSKFLCAQPCTRIVFNG